MIYITSLCFYLVVKDRVRKYLVIFKQGFGRTNPYARLLVGCLNHRLRGTNVRVGLAQPSNKHVYVQKLILRGVCRHITMFGENLSITGQDPSVSKSNQLHVDIFRFSFIDLRYIPQIPLKVSADLLKFCTSTGHSLNSIGSSATKHRFSLDIDIICVILEWLQSLTPKCPHLCPIQAVLQRCIIKCN